MLRLRLLLIISAACNAAAFNLFPPAPLEQAGAKAVQNLDRRQALTTSAVGLAGLFGFSGQALAFGGKLKSVNSQLAAYGLPQISSVPDGFSPLLELYGTGQNRDTLLVEFLHPSDWIVVKPNNDVNGEDGTIQAGEYAKGDTATFFVWDTGKKKIEDQDKDFFASAIKKAISQKGDNVYQDFKIINTELQQHEAQTYVIVDFKYVLLTGAGFEVERRGVASVTSEGNGVQVLWAATISARFKKTKEQLRVCAESFRVYADGIKVNKIDYNDKDFEVKKPALK
mmetsp:Transcript_9440/g.17168  ORF Transcript_9440/g.17168 Transcript_9440/m.17168 type:complete len:283 (+) Transcript_9440:27-875(+)